MTYGKGDGNPPGPGLAYLMYVFQECRMIGEHRLHDQMHHFSSCGQCLVMGRMGQGRGDLHPFLRQFIAFVEASESARVYDAQRLHLRGLPGRERLRTAIEQVGHQLERDFDAFLASLGNRGPVQIHEYERWHARRIQDRHDLIHGNAPEVPELEDASEPEPYTEPLDPGGDIGYAAERLVGSVIMALRDGWYDDRLDRVLSAMQDEDCWGR